MTLDLKRSLGLNPDGTSVAGQREQVVRYIRLKLEALGLPGGRDGDAPFFEVAHDLLAQFRQYRRLLDGYLCPADQRIQAYLDEHLARESLAGPIRLPANTFSIDRHGMARELSLPAGADEYKSDLLESYRTRQGVLHNPKSDRRTTQGVFHVAEGGLPIPADKVAVPKHVYGNLLHAALNPPSDLLRLPFTANEANPAELFCTLLLRPVVCPAVPGFCDEKTMEVRFFAPGSLVSNLDFVESIFGNAGDPYLPENDAALDVEHWTGHTGCVILAPHLPHSRKKDLGLPHWDHATDRQREQGMCWRDGNERYNDGRAFKVTSRTSAGVMVTVIADNYFGYCKKEVKTQISYAANLFGLAEEEHAGGAVAFASYSLGDQFRINRRMVSGSDGYRFADVVKLFGATMDVKSEGYAIDRRHPDVIYVPEDVFIDVNTQRATWTHQGVERAIKLLPNNIYVHPTGYKVRLEKHPGAPSWRLVGTEAEGTFCHKPCTVSGGGKSEISKSLTDAVQYGPIFVADLEKDFDEVDRIFKRDYSTRVLPRFRDDYSKRPSRPILSPERSVGSVIKLLTPSPGEFTDEYNAWLETIPDRIRAMVFIIKRFYRPEWGRDWRTYFGVEEVNGAPAHSLKMGGRKLVGSYLRVGLSEDGNWRMYKLRQDFIAADKVQMEDDITASVTVPAARLPHRAPAYDNPSLKLTKNCEYRLFQRPDEAIHPGYDAQTELDMAQPGLFASNFEPLTPEHAREITEDVMEFDKFRPAMRATIQAAAQMPAGYFVCSARPRIVDGKRTKNPRYLQVRPDIARPRDRYVAEVGVRLRRRIPLEQPVVFPVNAVLSGRRNNPAAAGVRPLAVYNPIHYQELPELFMDYVCSLTGKSPSTTGAGSEGALTKGPFNALPPVTDLNNAVVSLILTGYDGFSTAAGYVGPKVRVDHDISLLIPEIWARLPVAQRDARYLIEHGHLEPVKDFDHDGRPVLASRLGYRITSKFVHTFFGKIFDSPQRVFTDHILRPETQDLASFVDGVRNITEAQQGVALGYFADGSVDAACPPLRALLHVMAHGTYQGMTVSDHNLREMFTRAHVLASDWYGRRLETKRERDVSLWKRHVSYLEAFLARPGHSEVADELDVPGRLERARAELRRVSGDGYVAQLVGTIGADPMHTAVHGSDRASRELIGASP